MRGNRRVDTKPEIALRRALHARGLRFRKDRRIEADDTKVRADVVFVAKRVAVFVDGCFWHGCSAHFRAPSSNVVYWEAKIERNRTRDRKVTKALQENGWVVLRLWEHAPIELAVEAVLEALRHRGNRSEINRRSARYRA